MNRVSVCIEKINVECVKRASQDGVSVFVKA